MNTSFAASIFFILSYLALASGVYLVKKSEKRLYGIIWLGLIPVTLMCYAVLLAALMNLIHIPVNIISIGVAELITAAILWYRILRGKERQTYRYEWIDLIFTVTLLGAILLLMKQRYGFSLNLHYATIDPAAHLKDAMNVVNNQKVSSMFYAALNNALFLETLAPLTIVSRYYKLFLLAELCNFGLSALTFYGAMRRYATDRFLKISAYIMTFVFLFGYSLNNTLYGFTYLGMGITVVVCLITLMDGYLTDELMPIWSIGLLSLGCLGLFESYVLFMPVTYFAMLICVLIKQKQKEKLISLETVKLGLAIFLIPCILGLLYTYLGVFSGGVTVSSAIAAEGGIYRDFYSNFLPFLPLALFGFWNGIREKKNRLLMLLFPLIVCFIAGLFVMGMQGKVSSYYYYKNYFLLWPVVLLLLYMGLQQVAKNTRALVVCYFVIWAGVLGMYLIHFEERVQAKNVLYDQLPKSAMLCDVYSYNWQTLGIPGYSTDKIELYEYTYTELLEQGADEIPSAAYWEDDYWFQAITNQRLEGYDYWNNSEEECLAKIKEDTEYVVVLTDDKSDIYQNNREYFDSLEKVYENGAGFIGKVQ